MARTRPARARISPRSRAKFSPATVLVASDWAPIRAFEPIIRDAPESIYGDLLPVLRRADLRIVNCECALTSASAAVWKSGAVFKGEPAHVAGLTAVPFDIACLANNHVLDYGVAGLRETLRVLARAGIHSVGAGLTEAQALAPLSVLVNGQPIHIVNLSEGEDLTASTGGPGVFGWDIALAAAQTRALKKIGGVVIVIAHCGLEYVPFPPPYVVAAFRALIEAGADCVIGHHPHVPQGIEWWCGRPIIYSLGNFVFYQPTTLHHRKTGFCVSMQCEGGRVTGIELHPYRITDTGTPPPRLEGSAGLRHGPDATVASLSHGCRARARMERVAAVLRRSGIPRRSDGHPRQDGGRAAQGRRDVPQPHHHDAAPGTLGDVPDADDWRRERRLHPGRLPARGRVLLLARIS